MGCRHREQDVEDCLSVHSVSTDCVAGTSESSDFSYILQSNNFIESLDLQDCQLHPD